MFSPKNVADVLSVFSKLIVKLDKIKQRNEEEAQVQRGVMKEALRLRQAARIEAAKAEAAIKKLDDFLS